MRRGEAAPSEQAQRWRVEAEQAAARAVVLGAENTALRARAVELEGEVGELRKKVKTLTGQVDALKGTVKSLADKLFGRSSEKTKDTKAAGSGRGAGANAGDTPGSGSGAEGGSGGEAGAGGEGEAKPRKRGQQRGSRGHGRRGYSHLDTEERVHDLPIEERMCGVCGAQYAPFGQESCDQIEWEVHLVRVHHVRPTYKRERVRDSV